MLGGFACADFENVLVLVFCEVLGCGCLSDYSLDVLFLLLRRVSLAGFLVLALPVYDIDETFSLLHLEVGVLDHCHWDGWFQGFFAIIEHLHFHFSRFIRFFLVISAHSPLSEIFHSFKSLVKSGINGVRVALVEPIFLSHYGLVHLGLLAPGVAVHYQISGFGPLGPFTGFEG